MAGGWGFYRPYVPVGLKRERGERALRRLLRGEKRAAAPVVAAKRAIVQTFWGRAWCENLERYSDFASRLPRGRQYIRNGSVLDLQVRAGRVRAHVAGSSLYTVDVSIAPLARRRWQAVVAACTGKIGSLIGLLRGELSRDVLAVLTDPQRGLFPAPREIAMQCSCPDWATMCKHVAATLYGVGVRLDETPDLFFTLRGVTQTDLVARAAATDVTAAAGITRGGTGRKRIAANDLGAIFGIEVAPPGRPKRPVRSEQPAATRRRLARR
jgi:uncharacterized Zn finger protein